MGVSPPIDRFMSRVDKAPDGHWMWTGVRGGRAPHEYGYFRPGTRATDPKVPAHRWLWEHTHGPVADEMELDHVCQTKLCVNPAHLEPVTMLLNRERMRLTTCRSGRHDLTLAENVRWDRQGRRRGCLVCWTESQQRRVRSHGRM